MLTVNKKLDKKLVYLNLPIFRMSQGAENIFSLTSSKIAAGNTIYYIKLLETVWKQLTKTKLVDI